MAASEWYSRQLALSRKYRDIQAAVYEFEECQRPRTKKVMQNVANQFNVSVVEMKWFMEIEPTYEDFEKHDEKYTIVIPIETEGEKHD